MTFITPSFSFDAPTLTPKPLHDPLRYWGYILLAVSLVVYGIEEAVGASVKKEEFAVFLAHYVIAIAYTVMLWYNGSLGIVRSFRKEHLSRTVVVLNLFLVSAYALNREIPVFDQSTTWLCVFILFTSASLLSFAWYQHMPKTINALQLFALGSSLLFYVYLAISCAGYYAVGGIGLLAFGIGGHILVPLFLAIASISIISQLPSPKLFIYIWLLTGVIITMSIVTVFTIVWSKRISAIERIDTHSVLQKNAELPVWVRIASAIQDDWITQRILKSNLTYRTSDGDAWRFMPERRSWNEQRVHDPLVLIATLLRRPSISREDRIKILEAITEDRHKAQDRLWSGDNLITSDIVIDADIFADLKISYTEMYLSVRNDINRNWSTEQEAIYVFQLPEGSVITSLSLWINGQEEKAILTSKQKAAEAYTTIVGRLRRDPSVVHWQEGNTVTVRVFPCTPDEKRKFKLGITSPLIEDNGRVYYRKISFKGPSASEATELSRITFIGHPDELELPRNFKRDAKGEYIRDGEYDPTSAISFKAPSLKKNQFTFGGFTYSVAPLERSFESKSVSTLYLDINKSWSREELNSMRPLLSKHKIFVNVDETFVELNNENWDILTSECLTRNFSIFPFHRVGDVAASLVVSKGRELSPFLADFKDSEFARQTAAHFATKEPISVFNLSSSTSTYVRSLRELRAIKYTSGSANQLFDMLKKGTFPVYNEGEQRIVLHDAEMSITKLPSVGDDHDNAPDHLARLFAYNNIMRQVGVHFFSDDFIDEAMIQEATLAYVVSPVSSLIVLETQADYERFGIQDSSNSLHNASKFSAGAVPEPHEWALIIVSCVIIIICISKQWNRKHAILK